MTEKEIKAADLIIRTSTLLGVSASHISSLNHDQGRSVEELKEAARYLRTEQFLEIDIHGSRDVTYRLTTIGADFKRTGKSYSIYLKEKANKSKIQSEKEKRDDRHKDLQIRDLEAKLELMNKEQLRFWNRQRWQFWLTLILGAGGFLLGIINFIRSMIIE